jgi:hypothetical protein
VEQRIGPSIQPLQGAAVDPAFVPGITGAQPGGPQDAAKDAPRDDVPGQEPAAEAEDSPETVGDDAAPEASDEPDVPADGPVFEAADRRARIVADGRGVRLALDDQECEFRWDEIGAVETETARFGKRYTVTVHTPDRRWYPIEIEAASRAQHAEWDAQLDAVLDAYFED